MYLTLALAAPLLVLIGVLVDALLLHLLNKYFNVHDRSYVHSIVIVVLSSGTALYFEVLGQLFRGFTGLVLIIGLIGSVYVAYRLYRMYYRIEISKFLIIWLINCVVAAILIFGVTFGSRVIFQPFVVVDQSMSPLFSKGDYVFVEKWNTAVQKGDIVVAYVQGSRNGRVEYQLEQIVGMPGDTIKGTTVPQGEYIISDTYNSLNSIYEVPYNAVVGKPLFDLQSI